VPRENIGRDDVVDPRERKPQVPANLFKVRLITIQSSVHHQFGSSPIV
jgi:hypothetical protein